MLIRDNKFDEFTLPDKISKKNMTHALARLFGQRLETNQRASVHVWRKIEHVRPPQTTQCIPYELLLHTLNSIGVCAIERPPHTTSVFKFLAQKVHSYSKKIKNDTTQHVRKLNRMTQSHENVIDLHLPTCNSNALASHHPTSVFKSL
jgi:hypothetical protein